MLGAEDSPVLYLRLLICRLDWTSLQPDSTLDVEHELPDAEEIRFLQLPGGCTGLFCPSFMWTVPAVETGNLAPWQREGESSCARELSRLHPLALPKSLTARINGR